MNEQQGDLHLLWPKSFRPQEKKREREKGSDPKGRAGRGEAGGFVRYSHNRRSCHKQLTQLTSSLFSVSCALQLFLSLAWAKYQMTDVSVPAAQRGHVCDSCSSIWSCGWWEGYWVVARESSVASFAPAINVLVWDLIQHLNAAFWNIKEHFLSFDG